MWVLEMMWVVTLMAICGNNVGCKICDIGGWVLMMWVVTFVNYRE